MKNRILLTISTVAMILCMFQITSLAFSPRSPQSIEKMRQSGDLSKAVDFARRMQNNKITPKKALDTKKHTGIGGPSSVARIPKLTGSVPTTGSINILVLKVNFPNGDSHDVDRFNRNTKQVTQDLMFKERVEDADDDANYPYESVRAYYQRSSYGKLNISGDVMDWYTMPHSAEYYEEASASEFCFDSDSGTSEDIHYIRQMRAQSYIIKEVLDYHISKGLDVSKYDNNNDKIIDCIYVLWNHADEEGFWWAYQNYYENTQENKFDTFDGLMCNAYAWVSVEPSEDNANNKGAATWIHEFGHALGLPDYYDYDWSLLNNDATNPEVLQPPHGGTGSLGMMDRSIGDFDAFSKYMLGWLEQTVVSSGSQNISLRPLSQSPDAVLIMPNIKSDFGEYYMVEYRSELGNDSNIEPGNDGRPIENTYANPGITIWHINSELRSDGYFICNNTESKDGETKLINRVTADGTDHINKKAVTKWVSPELWNIGDWSAGSRDFYRAGDLFTPETNPSSNDWNGNYTGIRITNLKNTAEGMKADFSIDSMKSIVCSDLYFADLSGHTIRNIPTTDTQIQAIASMTNNSEEDRDVLILIVAYNKSSNELKQTYYNTVNIPHESATDISVTCQVSDGDKENIYFKGYVLDSFDTMYPLHNTIRID